jgi:diguanylate cyclase (GGDEF)-like protein
VSPPARTERILVVDDEEENVRMLKRIVRGAGFTNVRGVSDSAVALKSFVEFAPDLVLLDLRMPDPDGFTLLGEMQAATAPGCFVPIVALTGDADTQVRLRALSSGAADFILKPFLPAEVVLRLSTLVALRAQQTKSNEYAELLAEQVESRTADLAEEREFLRSLLSCMEAGVLACDAKGDLRLANDALLALGVDPAELGPQSAGRPHNLFAGDGLLPLLGSEDPLRRAFAGEAVRNVELRIGEGPGAHVVVAHARPIEGERGERLGAVLALHDVTERRRAEDEFRHRALHDPLTGLPNRELFLDRVEQGIARFGRSPGSSALLFIDLDGFKYVNDTLGHLIGDSVLLVVAERLERCLRPADTAARLGGDEFAVFCEAVTDTALAEQIAERILLSLTPPIEVEGQHITIAASIGITVTDSAERSAMELLRDADAAMFLAKERGRGRHEMFDAELRTRLLSRLHTESGVRRALDQDEFDLYYQPLVDLDSAALVGAEALIRWKDPDGRDVPPDSFIPIAEQSGLITRIGDWVLQRACRDLEVWSAAGMLPPGFSLSLNVSVRDLWSVDLVAQVREATQAHRIRPEQICLELTETALMRDAVTAARILEDLRGTGVRIAIDDFGTGYSSLSSLRRLPIDVLKIDSSFVRGLPQDAGDIAVVDTIIRLAQTLGLTSLAEGIETDQQLEVLQGSGCQRGQGFLFSQAVPAAEFASLLSGRSQVGERRKAPDQRGTSLDRRPRSST